MKVDEFIAGVLEKTGRYVSLIEIAPGLYLDPSRAEWLEVNRFSRTSASGHEGESFSLNGKHWSLSTLSREVADAVVASFGSAAKEASE